ncbi:flagellar motor protein MotB [Parafrankia colletiae]|uniref:Flagellar motor protein MotB n=1 Tax=Parafrankia colletiae TaxID=573497 RepID=A0A1S1RL74_9ACTN|nr:OmpA family protein [Parafrankia colletiae]MCK9902454.1 OmpA family protein [Frankia sp. Cpl3]OHV46165.1 flagellar motor protein MotB [Parafrankia colletiae]
MSSPSVALLRRPRPVAFVVALVLAGLLLALVALWLRRGPIEGDLADRATEAVRASGAARAWVSVDGRDVVLHGRFDSTEEARQAQAAAAVFGAGSVRLAGDAVVAAEPSRPLVIGVSGDGGAPSGLALSATVPDSATRADLLGSAADASGGAVSATVTVDPQVATPVLEALGEVATALGRQAGARSVTIDGSSLVLQGGAPDAAARATIGAEVLAAVQPWLPGASLDNRLAVGAGATVVLDPETGVARPAGQAADSATGGSTTGSTAGSTTGGATGGTADGTRAALRVALEGTRLTFAIDDATLDAAVRAGLDKVARALLPGDLTVLVGGHTDSTGPLALNQALSVDRASAAREYLVLRGVPAERVRAAGFGPARPVADNATVSGRAENRRVDVTPLAD